MLFSSTHHTYFTFAASLPFEKYYSVSFWRLNWFWYFQKETEDVSNIVLLILFSKGIREKEGEGGGGLDEEISGWFVSFIVNYETKACNCSVPLTIQLHIHSTTRRIENNQWWHYIFLEGYLRLSLHLNVSTFNAQNTDFLKIEVD